MKLECTIHRITTNPKTGAVFVGTVVDFDRWPSENVPDKTAPAARYHFKPISDDPNAAHVCDVTNDVHAHRLLECNGAYRIYGAAEAPSLPTPGTSQAAAAPIESDEIIRLRKQLAEAEQRAGLITTASATAASVGGELAAGALSAMNIADEAFKNAVQAVLDMPVRDLKAMINVHPREVLTAALVAERATEKPRKGFVEVLEAHLGDGTPK